MTVKAVWHIVKESAKHIGVAKLAPHDLRRTCARLCHASGGELEQIQFPLGHVSVQTTERYLGCKQRIRSAVMLRDEIDYQEFCRREQIRQKTVRPVVGMPETGNGAKSHRQSDEATRLPES